MKSNQQCKAQHHDGADRQQGNKKDEKDNRTRKEQARQEMSFGWEQKHWDGAGRPMDDCGQETE